MFGVNYVMDRKKLVGEVSPYAAILHHHAERSARRDDAKYAATPSSGAKAPQRPRCEAGGCLWNENDGSENLIFVDGALISMECHGSGCG